MNVAKQYPLLARYQTRAHLAIGQMALFSATENECAGIARVVDDLPCAAVQKFSPDKFTLMRPAAQSPREQELLRMEDVYKRQTPYRSLGVVEV